MLLAHAFHRSVFSIGDVTSTCSVNPPESLANQLEHHDHTEEKNTSKLRFFVSILFRRGEDMIEGLGRVFGRSSEGSCACNQALDGGCCANMLGLRSTNLQHSTSPRVPHLHGVLIAGPIRCRVIPVSKLYKCAFGAGVHL